jgi:ABC-type uncharacterized transport system fused permease/ATPase subunit
MAQHQVGSKEAAPDGGTGCRSPLWAMWQILRPSARDVLSGKELEVGAAVLVALCRAWEIRLKTNVVKVLDATLTSRDMRQFRISLLRITLITMFGSALSLTYQYIQARISWKWRRKLLGLLHDKYFDGMRYYQISEGGAYGADRMADADARLTDSMNATVNGFAHAFNNTVYTAIAGMFSTLEIARLFGWRMAAVPYAYVIGTFVVVEIIAPVSKTWRMLGREVRPAMRSRQVHDIL